MDHAICKVVRERVTDEGRRGVEESLDVAGEGRDGGLELLSHRVMLVL